MTTKKDIRTQIRVITTVLRMAETDLGLNDFESAAAKIRRIQNVEISTLAAALAEYAASRPVYAVEEVAS